MSETATPVEPSLSDYIREENAKERAAETGELPVEPVPAVKVAPQTESEASDVPATAPAEPVVEAKPDDAERNADGTFKPKRKQVTNTGEWARNQKLTAELRQAQEELTRLRSQPAAPAPPIQAQPSDPNDPEPTLDKFLDKPDPYAALAVEAAKWAVRESKREAQAAEQRTLQEQAQAELAEREEAFTQTHPDYLDKVNTLIQQYRPHPAILNAMADDDQGPAVAYFLAEHPDEVQRLALLTPVQAVKEIGKLSSRLTPVSVGSGPQAGSTSKAKPLIKPVSGAPVAPESKPPDELPFGSRYIREMNAKERREREGLRGA